MSGPLRRASLARIDYACDEFLLTENSPGGITCSRRIAPFQTLAPTNLCDISRLWRDAQSYFRVDYRWMDAANALDPNVPGYNPYSGPYQIKPTAS
jgi:hypothetical protein